MAKLHYKNAYIHYTDSGNGRPLLLLHGFLEDLSMWEGLEKALPKKFRVIKVDLPGHGKSDCYGYIHSMEFMAECVAAVLASAGIRKCSILGHSMGGYVALAFAEKHPDKVSKLILYHTTAKADSIEKKQNRNRAISLAKQNYKSFVRSTIPMLFRHKFRIKKREEIKALKSKALGMSAQGIIAALAGMRDRIDREIVVKFAPYPILYVAGKKDPAVLFETLLPQLELGEHVQALILEEAGHMSFIEEPKLAFKGIKRFLG